MNKIITSFTCFLLLSTILFSQNTYNSILAEGETYKLAIKSSGIYKLTYDAIKNNTDINVDVINPANLRIYGNNGGLLPLNNSTPRADDLVENPVYLNDGGDNRFNEGDYILFYAEGADRIYTEDNAIKYEKNIYDLNNYYFLKLTASPGKKIETIDGTTSSPNVINYSEQLYRHENEFENLLGQFGSTQGSGKVWYGETFTGDREQNFDDSFRFNTLAPNRETELLLEFAARSASSSEVRISVDGNTFSENLDTSNLGNIERAYAARGTINEKFNLTNNRPRVDVIYSGSSSETQAWLDYIQMIVSELNIYRNTPLYLRNRGSINQASAGFSLEGNNLFIWDISDIGEVKSINYNTSNGNQSFSYSPNGRVKSFVAFNDSEGMSSPEFLGKVENQNLHSLDRADMVIIYHPDFIKAAQKLSEHRAQHDGLKIELVNIFEIYNEFGGGKQDVVSVRDFTRMLHQRDPNFKYLLMFGDATYDFRGIYTDLDYQNFVPSYQTQESLNSVIAFPSDDYFALLSDDEGMDNMVGDLDLGVGRIPCSSLAEGLAVVDKIIHYDTNPNRFGEWRTKIGFAADDVDVNWDTTHMRDSDGIAENTASKHPCFVQQKTYFDSYVQEATSGGQRYPDANKAISDNIFKGELVFSYLGHGGPRGLSQERVIQVTDVANWKNLDKLPVFITATCSFTGYDEPLRQSAGEELILNPNGGAVAIFTTVRSVYANSNQKLTSQVYNLIFNRVDGKALRLGDVLAESQNQLGTAISITTNTRKFALMGDPSMQLALPEYDIKVTEFNGEAVSETRIDTVGALGRATLRGQVESPVDGSVISNFNGTVSLTIYDKSSELSTLVNDGLGEPMKFNVKSSILYKGTASVQNGEFEVSFILPQDINFSYGLGSIHFYANDGQTDAIGCYEKLAIGGVSSSVIDDNEGPIIDIFFNDRSFQFGGTVNKEPLLLVDLQDENGINLSGISIGHDITATLEDQNGEKIVLNEFYTPTVDKLGEGTVEYEMPTLEPGPHKLYLKAWDILNNSSEEVTEFVVASAEEGFIENVYNYPNPFSTNTQFMFDHDLTSANIDIVVNIYTISGKLVKSIVDNRFTSGTRLDDINWDGRDDYGNKLAKGIYLYKINLYAPELDVRRESEFRKLSIIY